MQRLKFSCLDIILFSAFAYAVSDCVKNWAEYKTCSLPLHIYIIVSVVTLLIFRLMHFLGQVVSGETENNNETNANQPQVNGQQTNFAWERLNRLRCISIMQMVVVAPFFTAWTIYGSIIFVKINTGFAFCSSTHQ